MYAIYKENFIPGIGGVTPMDAEVLQCNYNDWKLVKFPIAKFDNYYEFKMIPVSEEIAEGIQFIGVSDKPFPTANLMKEMPGLEMPMTVVTTAKKTAAILAQEFLDKVEKKIITRANVRQYKDFEDDFADTKYLIQTLMSILIDEWSKMPEDKKRSFEFYSDLEEFSKNFIAMQGDLKKIDNSKIEKIMQDERIISSIVSSYYLTNNK